MKNCINLLNHLPSTILTVVILTPTATLQLMQAIITILIKPIVPTHFIMPLLIITANKQIITTTHQETHSTHHQI